MSKKLISKQKATNEVSVVIVTYNSEAYIVKCISSIYTYVNDLPSLEIIVVDNNSNDNTISRINEKFSSISIIINRKNEGFSKAINQGINIAKGKNIFILNPDSKLKNNAISLLLKKINNSNYKIIGPEIQKENGELQNSKWKFPTLFTTICGFVYLDFMLCSYINTSSYTAIRFPVRGC